MEAKIPSISVVATNSALTAVEIKILDVTDLVKKTDYDAKISDIKSRFINVADYNEFTTDIVGNKVKSEGLVGKYAITEFIKNANLDKKKVAALATKAELKAEHDKK